MGTHMNGMETQVNRMQIEMEWRNKSSIMEGWVRAGLQSL